jgi:hypothetical protein
MESIVAIESTPKDTGQDRASHPDPGPKGHIGWIVAGSLATGLVAALLLAAAPFIPAEESAVTGAVLCGFALGWAMLAVLSVRFTDQPQRWAADSTAPASANPATPSPGHGGSDDAMSRVSALVSTAARLGLGRLYAQSAFGSLPPRSRDEVRASVATASTFRSTIDEYVQAMASSEQAAALRDFADKPLIVLTAGSGHDAAWSAAQNRMATLSTNSVHRVIAGATHEGLIANEEDAAATTQAILDVVSSVRSPGRLVR